MTQINRIKGAMAAERLAAALHALSALHIVAARQTAVDMFEGDMRAAFRELAEALGYTVTEAADAAAREHVEAA